MVFESVFGHKNALTTLENMFQKNALPNAFCFHGVEGIGKKRIARELAQAMFCDSRSACGTCPACNKFQKSFMPDYMEIKPEGRDIKVAPIREITEQLHYKPFETDYRVFLIDQAETMNESAANAFLKSLEEPPPYVYFFLITSNLEKLLPTIRSRCQKLAFQPLTEKDKENILVHSFQIDPELAFFLARISFRKLETDPESWESFKGNVDFILNFFNLMHRRGVALDFCSEKLRKKDTVQQFFDHFLACLREGMMLANGLEPSPLFKPWTERFQGLAREIPATYWVDATQDFLYRIQNQNRNLNWSYWFNQFSVNGLGLEQKSKNRHRDWLVKKGIYSRG